MTSQEDKRGGITGIPDEALFPPNELRNPACLPQFRDPEPQPRFQYPSPAIFSRFLSPEPQCTSPVASSVSLPVCPTLRTAGLQHPHPKDPLWYEDSPRPRPASSEGSIWSLDDAASRHPGQEQDQLTRDAWRPSSSSIGPQSSGPAKCCLPSLAPGTPWIQHPHPKDPKWYDDSPVPRSTSPEGSLPSVGAASSPHPGLEQSQLTRDVSRQSSNSKGPHSIAQPACLQGVFDPGTHPITLLAPLPQSMAPGTLWMVVVPSEDSRPPSNSADSQSSGPRVRHLQFHAPDTSPVTLPACISQSIAPGTIYIVRVDPENPRCYDDSPVSPTSPEGNFLNQEVAALLHPGEEGQLMWDNLSLSSSSEGLQSSGQAACLLPSLASGTPWIQHPHQQDPRYDSALALLVSFKDSVPSGGDAASPHPLQASQLIWGDLTPTAISGHPQSSKPAACLFPSLAPGTPWIQHPHQQDPRYDNALALRIPFKDSVPSLGAAALPRPGKQAKLASAELRPTQTSTVPQSSTPSSKGLPEHGQKHDWATWDCSRLNAASAGPQSTASLQVLPQQGQEQPRSTRDFSRPTRKSADTQSSAPSTKGLPEHGQEQCRSTGEYSRPALGLGVPQSSGPSSGAVLPEHGQGQGWATWDCSRLNATSAGPQSTASLQVLPQQGQEQPRSTRDFSRLIRKSADTQSSAQSPKGLPEHGQEQCQSTGDYLRPALGLGVPQSSGPSSGAEVLPEHGQGQGWATGDCSRPNAASADPESSALSLQIQPQQGQEQAQSTKDFSRLTPTSVGPQSSATSFEVLPQHGQKKVQSKGDYSRPTQTSAGRRSRASSKVLAQHSQRQGESTSHYLRPAPRSEVPQSSEPSSGAEVVPQFEEEWPLISDHLGPSSRSAAPLQSSDPRSGADVRPQLGQGRRQ